MLRGVYPVNVRSKIIFCAKAVPKFMVMKFEVFESEQVVDFLVAHFPVNFPLAKYLEFCHRNFTTFFTLKLTVSQQICHPTAHSGGNLAKYFSHGTFILQCHSI